MKTPNNSLTSLSQLKKLNRGVWLSTERNRKVSQGLNEQEFVDALPPSENADSDKMTTTDATDVPALPNDKPDAALPKSGDENLPTLSINS